MFFPLDEPARWRVIAMQATPADTERRVARLPDESAVGPLTLVKLQRPAMLRNLARTPLRELALLSATMLGGRRCRLGSLIARDDRTTSL